MYIIKVTLCKFDVSGLFCSKGIEEKPLGGRLEESVKENVVSLREGGGGLKLWGSDIWAMAKLL